MFATGVANMVVALRAGPVAWAWFVGGFPIASKVGMVLAQYLVTRHIVRRRIRVAKALAVSA